jgi:hypothetical protein
MTYDILQILCIYQNTRSDEEKARGGGGGVSPHNREGRQNTFSDDEEAWPVPQRKLYSKGGGGGEITFSEDEEASPVPQRKLTPCGGGEGGEQGGEGGENVAKEFSSCAEEPLKSPSQQSGHAPLQSMLQTSMLQSPFQKAASVSQSPCSAYNASCEASPGDFNSPSYDSSLISSAADGGGGGGGRAEGGAGGRWFGERDEQSREVELLKCFSFLLRCLLYMTYMSHVSSI